MSDPQTVALAQVVMRVGGIQGRDDLGRLRDQIEYEKDRWERVVVDREQVLIALDHLRAGSNQDSVREDA